MVAAEVSNGGSDVLELGDSGDEVDGRYGFVVDVRSNMQSGVRDDRPLAGSTEAMAGLLYFVVSVYVCVYVCVCLCVGGKSPS